MARTDRPADRVTPREATSPRAALRNRRGVCDGQRGGSSAVFFAAPAQVRSTSSEKSWRAHPHNDSPTPAQLFQQCCIFALCYFARCCALLLAPDAARCLCAVCGERWAAGDGRLSSPPSNCQLNSRPGPNTTVGTLPLFMFTFDVLGLGNPGAACLPSSRCHVRAWAFVRTARQCIYS